MPHATTSPWFRRAVCSGLFAVACWFGVADGSAAPKPAAPAPLHERIDALIESEFAGPLTPPASDADFLRRAYLDLAGTLIDKKAGDFDASIFENRYIDALKALIAEKQKKKGKRVIQDTSSDAPTKSSNVIDLMAALKKSLDGAPAKPAAKKAPAKKPAAAHAVTPAPAIPPYPPPIKAADFKDAALVNDPPTETFEWDLSIGLLADYTDDNGVKARLSNLGFKSLGLTGAALARVVKAYQKAHMNNNAGSGVLADIKGHVIGLHDNP